MARADGASGYDGAGAGMGATAPGGAVPVGAVGSVTAGGGAAGRAACTLPDKSLSSCTCAGDGPDGGRFWIFVLSCWKSVMSVLTADERSEGEPGRLARSVPALHPRLLYDDTG